MPKKYESYVDTINPLSSIQGEHVWRLPVIGDVPTITSLLIRPDGYVAWVLAEDDQFTPDDLNQALEYWFGGI